jgi:uncharacterized protein (TIRG00374 family)
VTLALLGLVASRVDWQAAVRRVGHGEPTWFAGAVGLLLASQVVAALRWRVLLRVAGVETPLREAVRAYFIGSFSNNFLPTSFGGDIARAWIVSGSRRRLIPVLTSVLVDRISAVWCLFLVAWVAVAADAGAVPRVLVLALLCVTGASIAAFAGALVVARKGRGFLARRLPERVGAWARELRHTLALYVRQPRPFALASLLGLLFQAAAVGAVFAVARGIELHLPFSLAAVSAPLVLVITLFPISIAGFGVREGGMVLVLGAAGYAATDATLLSLTGVAALLLATLPGAGAILVRRGHVVTCSPLDDAQGATHSAA